MMRTALRGLAILAVLALAIDAAGGQPAAADKVVLREKKDGTVKTYDANLKLGPGGLQVIGAGNKLIATIAPEDLVRFVPGDLPGVDRNTVLNLISAEEAKGKPDYKKMQVGYADLQKKAAGAPEATRRYLDFKLATAATKVADESGDDEKWDELADVAAKAWAGFLGEYKASWETWPATRTQSRLLVELKKYDELARLWGRTAKLADLPADLKLEAGLRALDAEIRSGGGGIASAVELAAGLGKTTGPGVAKDKIAVYEQAATNAKKGDFAEGIKAVEAVIAKTKDSAVRGVGYAMIGELHLLAGKPRDAMWAFLWVETVYNQDKDEVLKAMCRLVEIFRAQADEDRAKAYREKIRRFREAF
jgi:hypothetical protein